METESTININGFNLHTRIKGEGTPLLWMHGLMCSMQTDEIFPIINLNKIAEKTKLIRFDSIGHGLSTDTPKSSDCEWKNLGLSTSALMDTLKIDQFIAAGYSMGAGVALETYFLHPDKVKALILVIPSTAWETRFLQQLSYSFLAFLSDLNILQPMLPFFLKLKPYPIKMIEEANPGIIDRTIETLCSNKKENYSPILKGASNSDYQPKDKMKEIKVPTLILAWENDSSHPLSTAKDLKERIPDSEIFIAKNGKDLSEFTDRTLEFLKRKNLL